MPKCKVKGGDNVIRKYLDRLEGRGKRHVLMIVTPRGEYPTQFMDKEYIDLEYSVLKYPENYIPLFEEGVPEIMRYAAFRLFIKPIICDHESLRDKSVTKLKRMNTDDIVSFVVAKHYYETVPFSEKTKEDAIEHGINLADNLLNKYPQDQFEFATVHLGKDSDQANVFINLEFNYDDDSYLLDYVYVY